MLSDYFNKNYAYIIHYIYSIFFSGTQLVASDKIAVFVTVKNTLSGQTRSHQVPAQKTLGETFMMTEFHEVVRIVSTQANTYVN